MIKAHLDFTGDDPDKYIYEIKSHGSMQDIVTEAGAMIGMLYSAIHEEDPRAGAVFRAKLVAALLVPDSPFWQLPGGECEIVRISEDEEEDTRA